MRIVSQLTHLWPMPHCNPAKRRTADVYLDHQAAKSRLQEEALVSMGSWLGNLVDLLEVLGAAVAQKLSQPEHLTCKQLLTGAKGQLGEKLQNLGV